MALSESDRKRFPAAAAEVGKWREQVRRISEGRDRVAGEAKRAMDSFLSRVVELEKAGVEGPVWRVLPLRVSDPPRVGVLVQDETWPKLGPKVTAWVEAVDDDAHEELRRAKRVQGLRRRLAGKAAREKADAAAEKLLEFHDASVDAGLPDVLDRLEEHAKKARPLPVTDLFEPRTGFSKKSGGLGSGTIIGEKELAALPDDTRTVLGAAYWEPQAKQHAVAAGNALRKSEVRRALGRMPVERLSTVTRGRISVAPLKRAGLNSVQDVLDKPLTISNVPGIGSTMGPRITSAARALARIAEADTPIRIRPEGATPEMRGAVLHLHRWDALRRVRGQEGLVALAKSLRPLVNAMKPGDTHYAVFGDECSLTEAVEEVAAFAKAIPSPDEERSAAWNDFLNDPARYHLMLEELGVLKSHEDAVLGELADTVKLEIQDLTLDTELMEVDLRGYQEFAARFALARKKALIGDESGLGKTVEALAVLAHLQNQGGCCALVVCPPTSVGKWVREASEKTRLEVFALHGPTRAEQFEKWVREGGVAVTTFGMLGWLEALLEGGDVDLTCVVVDEATQVTNPKTKRSEQVRHLVGDADYAILLAGEPFDSSLADLGTLVSYLQPDLVLTEVDLHPGRMHQQVAPAYLRRTREDVFTELPDLVVVDELLSLSPADQATYRRAVGGGELGNMRLAASASGERSTKTTRVLELASDAQANGRKMIALSGLPQVLNTLSEVLGGDAFGPLTRDMSTEEQEETTTAFDAAGPGAVLLVDAGGMPKALGHEGASTVVFVEPQLDERLEWEAISRTHALGDLRSVHVHRLISEGTVEEQLVQARDSATPPSDFRGVNTLLDGGTVLSGEETRALADSLVEGERDRLSLVEAPKKDLED